MKTILNENRKRLSKDEPHNRNKSDNFNTELPPTNLKSIKPLILQPKFNSSSQERNAPSINRESNYNHLIKFHNIARKIILIKNYYSSLRI